MMMKNDNKKHTYEPIKKTHAYLMIFINPNMQTPMHIHILPKKKKYLLM